MSTHQRRTWAAWAGTALLVTLCLWPRSMMPDETEGVAWYIPNLDKVAHLGLFGMFGVLWMRAAPPGSNPRTWWLKVLAAGCALAVATECAQAIPGVHRDPNLSDALADGVGVILGIGLIAVAGYREPLRS